MEHDALRPRLSKQWITPEVRLVVILDTRLPWDLRIDVKQALLPGGVKSELFVSVQLSDPGVQSQHVVMQIGELATRAAEKYLQVVNVTE